MPVDIFGQAQHVKVGQPWVAPLRLLISVADIQIEVTLRMHIRGLVTVPVSSRSITGIDCPFQLPSNSV